MKIGEDKKAKQAYELAYKRKQLAFNELLQFVAKYTDTEINAQELYNSPREYFFQLMEEKHAKDFPSSLKLLKVLDLLEIPVHQLDALINKLNTTQIELNLSSSDVPKKDFGIYATTDKQKSAYKAIKGICEGLNELLKQGKHFENGKLMQGSGGAIDWSFESESFTPRIQYILNH